MCKIVAECKETNETKVACMNATAAQVTPPATAVGTAALSNHKTREDKQNGNRG